MTMALARQEAWWWRAAKGALFRLDAERAHRLAMSGLVAWSKLAGPPQVFTSEPVEVMGLRFENPLGLAAGFDKDAEAVPAWFRLGFGFIEVGTVTAKPQPGNPKPRLFRLVNDGALLNRLGFNNHGAEACANALSAWRKAGKVPGVVGVNLGKSKVTPNEDAARDYEESFRAIADVADYVVVNVSSPNTPGLRDLQKKDEIAKIVEALSNLNQQRTKRRPLLVKLAPDLAVDDAHAVCEVAAQLGCDGMVVSNTTVSREGLVGPVPEGSGGISGAPVFERSTAMLKALTQAHQRLCFIGVGGVMSPETFQAKRAAGAALVQAYTGFVYGGPTFARRVLGSSASR